MPAAGLPPPFKYTTRRKAGATARVPRPKLGEEEQEVLYGEIQGKRASALEERAARALDKSENWHGYSFRHIIIAPRNTAGSIEIDFVAYNVANEERFIKVDGDWVHAQPKSVKKDKEDRDRINEYLRQRGLPELIVIPGHKLETQDLADQTIAEIS
jgi:hypothetical protein